jgi:hypothetical protein
MALVLFHASRRNHARRLRGVARYLHGARRLHARVALGLDGRAPTPKSLPFQNHTLETCDIGTNMRN